MRLERDMYVPALRWRQGEYQALFRLSDEAKSRVVPHITIPRIEYDFEAEQATHSIDEHVEMFTNRYKKKWGNRSAWIGVHKSIVDQPLADGSHIFTRVFNDLSSLVRRAVPLVAVDASAITIEAVRPFVSDQGVGLSVRLEDLMRTNARTLIDDALSRLRALHSDTDLLVDFGAPNFEPYNVFADALLSAFSALGNLRRFRNFVVLGTAIPSTFKDIAKGGDEILRHDWLFYRTLVRRLPTNLRCPNFGDYTIVHPEFSPVDMRKIKSGGKLVYTKSTAWSVQKGGAFRDDPGQMHSHCAAVVAASEFSGAGYSYGDTYIAQCAARQVSPSTQTRWKEVAINHHITHVLDDLARLFGSS